MLAKSDKSIFASLLRNLVDAKYSSRRAFARAAEPGRCENAAQAYIARVIAGKIPPPLYRVEDWADALGLAGQDQQEFIDEATLAHTPARVRLIIDRLKRQLAEAQASQEAQSE